MQKYVIVKFLERIEENTEFAAASWPLHVTLAPRFAVDWDSTNLFEKMSTLLAKKQPIKAIAGGDEKIGPKRDVLASILDANPALMALHGDITALLKKEGATFDDPEYCNNGYKAHVTVQLHKRLSKGDSIIINDLTIVDMYPGGDISRRKVLRTIKLQGK